MARLEFKEPGSEVESAGYLSYKRVRSPYELYMEEEGIPIFRGIGVRDTRDLTLGAWKRLAGRGCFLHLNGLEGLKGMYVIEVPAAGALNAEKHMYDEFYLVIEGRGSTEVWREGQAKPQAFEWQAGTLFMAPINAWHRLVNATASPALIIAANNAPPIMNIFNSRRFIFENDFDFRERFDGSADFFKAKTEVEAEPVRGRAAVYSNVFADIVNCELPLDNQRAPGYRRIQPYFHGYPETAGTGGFIAEYPTGRYSKAHYHQSGAVIVCLKGKGYTFNWPIESGPRPWENGMADRVKVAEYVAGGLVAAAPGGGNWFHQHFSVSKEPMRTINFWGGPTPQGGAMGEDGEEVRAWNVYGIDEGGATIHYHHEDPYVRRYYAQRLAEEDVEMQMPESLFTTPAGTGQYRL
ncbi:MAG: cupin [Chloroflexota bacterium]|nr:cupin [Chloroflexota bacterium]